MEKKDRDRIIELSKKGFTHQQIAEDPQLSRGVLLCYAEGDSRRRKVGKLLYEIEQEEKVVSTDCETEGVITPFGFVLNDEIKKPSEQSLFDQRIKQYESLIGAAHKESTKKQRDTKGIKEIVVIADLHIPQERLDLVSLICERHKGAHCVVAGDLNDFANLSRFSKEDIGVPSIRELMAKTDAFFDILMRSFSSVEVMFGNHDLRLPRIVAKNLNSADLAFITQDWLTSQYERRHGVTMVKNKIDVPNSDFLEIYHWHQIGDCLISHLETSGRVQGRGVERAHDFLYSWRNEIPFQPFQLILHSHTHRQSMFRHPMTGVHCVEIGALCHNPAYAFRSGKFHAVEAGYYYLVQQEGVTDFDTSRIYSF